MRQMTEITGWWPRSFIKIHCDREGGNNHSKGISSKLQQTQSAKEGVQQVVFAGLRLKSWTFVHLYSYTIWTYILHIVHFIIFTRSSRFHCGTGEWAWDDGLSVGEGHLSIWPSASWVQYKSRLQVRRVEDIQRCTWMLWWSSYDGSWGRSVTRTNVAHHKGTNEIEKLGNGEERTIQYMSCRVDEVRIAEAYIHATW